MRKQAIIWVVLSLVLFQRCTRPSYQYFDKATLYLFHPHDTLLYACPSATDTFVVKIVDYSWENEDKVYNKESLVIDLQYLNVHAKDTVYDNYWDMLIGRGIWSTGPFQQLNFRNFFGELDYKAPVITYTIGTHSIPNVYTENTQDWPSGPGTVKTVYYNDNYGIIAYIRFSGEKFELEEKYFK